MSAKLPPSDYAIAVKRRMRVTAQRARRSGTKSDGVHATIRRVWFETKVDGVTYKAESKEAGDKLRAALLRKVSEH